MNRRVLGGFGLENHIVFASQFLEEVLFGLRDFLFNLNPAVGEAWIF